MWKCQRIKNIKEKLESGEIQLIIGTHALFQEKVSFRDLGLAVIDEQDLIEGQLVFGFSFLTRNVQRVVLGHFVLLPCNFYNRVHWNLFFGAPGWIPKREDD